jgi:hypothetical protein
MLQMSSLGREVCVCVCWEYHIRGHNPDIKCLRDPKSILKLYNMTFLYEKDCVMESLVSSKIKLQLVSIWFFSLTMTVFITIYDFAQVPYTFKSKTNIFFINLYVPKIMVNLSVIWDPFSHWTLYVDTVHLCMFSIHL